MLVLTDLGRMSAYIGVEKWLGVNTRVKNAIKGRVQSSFQKNTIPPPDVETALVLFYSLQDRHRVAGTQHRIAGANVSAQLHCMFLLNSILSAANALTYHLHYSSSLSGRLARLPGINKLCM